MAGATLFTWLTQLGATLGISAGALKDKQGLFIAWRYYHASVDSR